LLIWKKTFLANAEIAMEPSKAVKEYKEEHFGLGMAQSKISASDEDDAVKYKKIIGKH
jgi:hypothetical protein